VTPRLSIVAIAALAALLLGGGAGDARRAGKDDTITLTMLASPNKQPAYDVLIPNFERVYPQIKIDITYGNANQLEPVELAAGNAPDLLLTQPGTGSFLSVGALAKAGYLAPMVKAPWVKWSLPSIISADKYGPGLFSFTPAVTPYGIFTNDDLFKKLGLKIPQTFAQLLDVCRKAKAAGTVALLFGAGSQLAAGALAVQLAVATVYSKDKHWDTEHRAGTVSFEGSQDWHQALQKLVDMNNAGCFEPGATGTTAVNGQFAQGQALMEPAQSVQKGLIDAAGPQFRYSLRPFPARADPTQMSIWVNPGDSVSVNADSSPEKQAASQTFVDFIARPKQNALYAETTGNVTQYQFLKKQLPSFIANDESAALSAGRYVLSPPYFWWNQNVLLALTQNVVGLFTGQRSIDDILNAMDAAWKQGPG
jgi:raffinose/stachyose/melibiose transport system substrate-binding protein